ncbi:MAG: hypothetical protein GYB67_11300 [Chloroflexi bacterium]|nr:hypothetical protein [Chloroflexota bacterium]
MDFLYDFKQAQLDRYEDAGFDYIHDEHAEAYAIEALVARAPHHDSDIDADADDQRAVSGHLRRVMLTAAHLLIRH